MPSPPVLSGTSQTVHGRNKLILIPARYNVTIGINVAARILFSSKLLTKVNGKK